MTRARRHLRWLLVCGALSAGSAAQAHAQWNVARFATETNRAYTSFGLDPAIVSTVGYGRTVGIMNHRMLVTADAGVVTAHLDTRDFRTRLGVQTSLLHRGALHLTGSATFLTRGTKNVAYEGLNFGADLSLGLGVYRQRWFAGGEAGRDKAVITHVTMTDWYRNNFYRDAKDGWYLDAGGTYHGGLVGGLTVGKTEVVARAGWITSERGNTVMPGKYASLGLAVGF